jgi:hypothetical protein
LGLSGLKNVPDWASAVADTENTPTKEARMAMTSASLIEKVLANRLGDGFIFLLAGMWDKRIWNGSLGCVVIDTAIGLVEFVTVPVIDNTGAEKNFRN